MKKECYDSLKESVQKYERLSHKVDGLVTLIEALEEDQRKSKTTCINPYSSHSVFGLSKEAIEVLCKHLKTERHKYEKELEML